MGMKISVHTKHVIEYGESVFNNYSEELYNLLKCAGAEINLAGEYDTTSDWEVTKEHLETALDTIRKWDEDIVLGFWRRDDRNGVTKQRILDTFETFLATGDHTDGYYHFSWI